jgi:hypothetical protein
VSFGAGNRTGEESERGVEQPDTGGGAASAEAGARNEQEQPVENIPPGRARLRSGLERLLKRLIATCGIVGIGVALGAILAASKVQGWITGLVVALVSVVLSAVLWSSRQS